MALRTLAGLAICLLLITAAVAHAHSGDDDEDDGFVSRRPAPKAAATKPAPSKAKPTVTLADDDDDDDDETRLRAKVDGAAATSAAAAAVTRAPKQTNFVLEYCLIAFTVAYVINFFIGKRTNRLLAAEWLLRNRGLLASKFTRVTHDDGTDLRMIHYNRYTVYLTGAHKIRHATITLNLLSRHDLLSVLWTLLFPAVDTVALDLNMDVPLDAFVFAVVPRRKAAAMRKDVADLTAFASMVVTALPEPLAVLSDAPEVAESLLAGDTMRALSTYGPTHLQLLHITDRSPYAAVRAPMIHSAVRMPLAPADYEAEAVLLRMVLFVADRATTVRLSVRAAENVAKLRHAADSAAAKAAAEELREAAAAKKAEKAREDAARRQAAHSRLSVEEQRRLEAKEARQEEAKRLKKMRKVVKA